MNRKIIVALVVLVAILAIGKYLQTDVATPLPQVEKPQVQPAPQPVIREDAEASGDNAAPVEQVPLPALTESDAGVREAAGELAQKLLAWLTPNEQIRKWVVAVDLAADGELVGKNRPLAYPVGAFKVSGSDGNFLFDTSNYGRTRELVDTLTAIPPVRAAAVYQNWRPLFEEAYRELGKPGNFDARLKLAIDRMLAVKPLSDTPALTQPTVFYRYADPKLEAASDIDKLLWRMGPDNSARLQAWLEQVRDAL